MAYSRYQLDRIGNLLIYITEMLGPTPKTKLLKLLYVLDEESVKKTGVPFTELTYTHLPKGPVATFVLNQIEKNRNELGQFIRIERIEGATLISPGAPFQDDEFSDFDLSLVDDILARFGHYSGRSLIEYTHREGSLWHRLHEKHNGSVPGNERTMDLTLLLEDEDIAEELKQAAKEDKAFSDYLTSKH